MKTKAHREPKTAIGSRRDVEVCACLWIDLLGYGAMLKSVDFDPSTEQARIAVSRLHAFHQVVAGRSTREFKTLVMNDGAIAHRDLSPRSGGVSVDFLVRSYRLFLEVNKVDMAAGFPGARAVLATGFRVRRHDNSHDNFIRQVGGRLIAQVKDKKMTVEAAILQAMAIKPPFDLVPELQANFAFTKAFLVDNAGSAAGFGGANFFIDMTLIPDSPPDWLTLSKYIDFKTDGMSGKFGLVSNVKLEHLGLHSSGLLDAFDVSVKITGTPETAKRLKALTRKGQERK